MRICVYAYKRICVYAYMRICVYVYMCICVYVYVDYFNTFLYYLKLFVSMDLLFAEEDLRGNPSLKETLRQCQVLNIFNEQQ